MKVSDVMISEVVTIPETATYKDAVILLLGAKISGAPVVNKHGEVVGMISEKDLFRVLYPKYNSFYNSPEDYLDFESREDKIKEVILHPICDFMAKDIITVEDHFPIMKVGALMLAKGIHRAPVVNKGTRKLLGIITREHIFSKVLDSKLNN